MDHFSRYKVDKNGCWIWQMSLDSKGYGSIHWKGKTQRAHRVFWEKFNGEIPDGAFLLHRCDVRSCVNPDHLFVGTHLDNMKDMVKKGRHVPVCGSKNTQTKLNPYQVIEIRNSKEFCTTLAKKFGVSHTNILAIKKGKTWKHI